MTAGDVIAWLEAQASEAHRASLARYGIPRENALGVPMGVMKKKARSIGPTHETALALWQRGGYEARIMAAHLAAPETTGAATMAAWASDFDSWAICDTCCYQLFSKAPPRWDMLKPWAINDQEFVKRAAFALIWALTRHDKTARDQAFEATFPMIQSAARDPRPLVHKAVDMALRAIGKRNGNLHRSA
ncbi:MAG: DNA alkylation repair protein, partial [Pseudomonadota bacterium]